MCGCGERCPWQCCTPSADTASTGQPQCWGWRPSDALGSFYHSLQCFVVQDRAVVIPYWGAVGKDALSDVVVEVPENLRKQMDLLQSPQEEDTLVSLLDQNWSIDGPREIFRDVDTQILKTDNTQPPSLDMDRSVCVIFSLPECHGELLDLLGVEIQVVDGALRCQVTNHQWS